MRMQNPCIPRERSFARVSLDDEVDVVAITLNWRCAGPKRPTRRQGTGDEPQGSSTRKFPSDRPTLTVTSTAAGGRNVAAPCGTRPGLGGATFRPAPFFFFHPLPARAAGGRLQLRHGSHW